MLLDEFLYKIGFQIDSGKLEAIKATLVNLNNAAQGVGVGVSDALKASFARNAELLQGVDDAVQNAKQDMQEFKQKVDETAQALNKAEQEAKGVNKATDGIKKANLGLGEMKQGFERLRDKFFFVGLASGALSALITKYLSTPLQNIDKLITEKNRLFDITNAQIDQAKIYNEQTKTTGAYLTSITTQVALKLLPTINQNTKGFNNFLKANRHLVVDGLTNVFKWIVKIGQVFLNTFRALNAVISGTIGWKGALLVLIGVLAVLKRAMLATFIASPIGWVMAAIAGLILLFDDLMIYLDGGESLFGDFWKPFLEWCNKAKALFETFKPYIMAQLEAIKQIFSGVIDAIIGIFKMLWAVLTGDFDLLKERWSQLWRGAEQIFNGIINGVKNSFNALVSYVKNLYDKYIAPITDTVSNLGTSIKNGVSGLVDDATSGIKSFFGFGDDSVKNPQLAPITGVTNSTSQKTYNAQATTNISINTNNPAIAQNTIANARAKTYDDVYRNFGGGD
ncbi:hypothetical protein U5B43_08755 [Campylobacter sp. 9BO]|uniref:phage tail protein n=1 Tax=Campylobacter sp. 9BO TaxID=3424759 RepID=UPI003D34C7B7